MPQHSVLLTAGHPTPIEPYVHAIEKSGARAEIRRPGDSTAIPDEISGVILAGGASVAPERYGSVVEPGVKPTMDRPRDELEFGVVTEALQRGFPVLGICRGFQLLNVHFGGTLYQELANLTRYAGTHRSHKDRRFLAHKVHVKGGRLGRVMGPGVHQVNSIHRQGVKALGAGLVATIRAEDGLVEGFETPDGQVLAVQWHPEELVDLHDSQVALFTDLLARAESRTWAAEVPA